MDITDLIPSIIYIYGAVLLFMLGAVATLWARMGNIQGELGGLKAEVTGLKAEVGELRTSLNDRIDGLEASLNDRLDGLQASTDLKTDRLQASVDALIKGQYEMQLQMQRNHNYIMMAILSHSHRPDGRVTFDMPPDFEAAAVADD